MALSFKTRRPELAQFSTGSPIHRSFQDGDETGCSECHHPCALRRGVSARTPV